MSYLKIKFLKTEISSKSEISNKPVNNNTQKNNIDNMEGERGDFSDAFNTFYSQFVCSTSSSEESLVKFSDLNIFSHINSKRNIYDQLRTIKGRGEGGVQGIFSQRWP